MEQAREEQGRNGASQKRTRKEWNKEGINYFNSSLRQEWNKEEIIIYNSSLHQEWNKERIINYNSSLRQIHHPSTSSLRQLEQGRNCLPCANWNKEDIGLLAPVY